MIDTSHGHARLPKGAEYLICPFTNGLLQGQYISTSSRHHRGSISAGLRKVPIGSSDVTDVFGVNSDQPCLGTSVSDYFNCTAVGSHQLDFSRYYYYVQISMTRDTTNEDVRISGVYIN
jgi:hypothetical protein